MKGNIFYLLLAVAALSVAVQSCTYKEEVPSPVRTVLFTGSGDAVYDDLTGDFSFSLSNDDGSVSLELRMGSQPDKVSQQAPCPETGLYTIGAEDRQFMILDGASMTDSAGTHELSEANISLLSEDGVCRIGGTVVGVSGNPMRFEAENISFSHSSSGLLELDMARGEYDGNRFYIELSGNGASLNMSITAQGGTVDNPVLPEGYYSVSGGSISDCVYVPLDGETGISDMFCNVARERGGYTLQGAFMTDEGEALRFCFEGLVSYSELPRNLYLALGGEWDMQTDGWYMYDSDTRTWVETDQGDGFTVTVSGMPDYSSFLVEDVFEQDFAMLMIETESGLAIPSSAVSNPVAMVHATSGSFILFPALYSFEAGRFVSEGENIPVSLSEDLSVMSIPSVEVDGVSYDWFGLIGRNTSSGSYSMFSNWNFIHVPDFVKAQAAEEAGMSCGKVILRGVSCPRVEGVIMSGDIISIEPILR
ncbi:MAG: hypothetical protein IAB93_07525 [Bacteroidetes bacterium]|uniref:Uncharacterized protein n=1 Tax=Candidatus Merdivivens pullistercoris TaxID=2840873 RepID=A0A9D9N9V2_9BACT|nr:hypothetical protein [Candidatus Merdivivens pullistercoris]